MEIKYDLLPKLKTRKHNLRVEIDLYPYATELYEELDNIGIIERVKEIPQLGVIKVKKKLAKTRFDYVVLQLYLHKLIKTHLQGDLRFTYNNYINCIVILFSSFTPNSCFFFRIICFSFLSTVRMTD